MYNKVRLVGLDGKVFGLGDVDVNIHTGRFPPVISYVPINTNDFPRIFILNEAASIEFGVQTYYEHYVTSLNRLEQA